MKSISGITSTLGIAANWIGQSVTTSDFAKNLNDVDNRQPENTPQYSSAITALGICGLFTAGFVAMKYLRAIPYQDHARRTEPVNSQSEFREKKNSSKKTIRISNTGSRMQKMREAKVNPPPPSRAKISKYSVLNTKSSKPQIAFIPKVPEFWTPRKNVQWTVLPGAPGSCIIRHVTDPGLHWKIEQPTEAHIKEMYLRFLKYLSDRQENPTTCQIHTKTKSRTENEFFKCLADSQEDYQKFEVFHQGQKLHKEDVENILRECNPQPGQLLRVFRGVEVTITRLWTPDLKNIPKESSILSIETFGAPSSLANETSTRTYSAQKRKHLSPHAAAPFNSPIVSLKKSREIINTPVFEAQYDLLKNNSLSSRLEKFIADAKFRSIPGGHAHKVDDWLSVPINPENIASGKGRWRILFQMSPNETRVYGIVDYHDNKWVHWREKDIAPALKLMKR